MKGHMENGKFHPHTEYKGVRKSRDQQVKSQGVKIRKARTVSTPKLKDVDIRNTNWGFHTENGEVLELELGNLSTAGFYWTGHKDSLNHFVVMMAGFQDTKQFIDDMKMRGITLAMLRPQMLKNISGKLVDDETDDGLYAMSGGDTVWKFGDLPEIDIDSNIDGWDFFGDGKFFTKKEEEAIADEFWMHYEGFDYKDFLKEFGEQYRSKLRKMINESKDLGELLGEIRNDDTIMDRFEMYDELQNPKINEGLHEAIKKLQKEGKVRKK